MNIFKKFFEWYNNNYELNLRVATFLFVLQIVHLIWLTLNVVLFKLFGLQVFPPQFNWLVGAVDYTEIPALFSVSLIYINDIILGKATKKTWLYLLLLNSQWFHILWITDEVVLENFTGEALLAIPQWLTWIAILVDYLELPVMWDTIAKTLKTKKEIY